MHNKKRSSLDALRRGTVGRDLSISVFTVVPGRSAIERRTEGGSSLGFDIAADTEDGGPPQLLPMYTVIVIEALKTRLARDGVLDVELSIHTRAKRSRFKEVRADGVWKIDIAAVPEGGAANDTLRRFLAEAFDVPPSSVEIVSGQMNRRKRVRITRSLPARHP